MVLSNLIGNGRGGPLEPPSPLLPETLGLCPELYDNALVSCEEKSSQAIGISVMETVHYVWGQEFHTLWDDTKKFNGKGPLRYALTPILSIPDLDPVGSPDSCSTPLKTF